MFNNIVFLVAFMIVLPHPLFTLGVVAVMLALCNKNACPGGGV